MIGTQPEGTISGVVISAVSHEGLSVTVNGKPARLAILTDDGQVIAAASVMDDLIAAERHGIAVRAALWSAWQMLKVRSACRLQGGAA